MVKVRNSIKWQDYAFVFILISDLISLAIGNENIHALIKPFVVPSIAFYFFSKEVIKYKAGKYLVMVLLFSWYRTIETLLVSIHCFDCHSSFDKQQY